MTSNAVHVPHTKVIKNLRLVQPKFCYDQYPVQVLCAPQMYRSALCNDTPRVTPHGSHYRRTTKNAKSETCEAI